MNLPLLLLSSSCVIVSAFVVNKKSPNNNNNYHITRKYYAVNPEFVKKSGGGVPLVASGNRQLFDPAQAGKLGGTDNLNVRLNESYHYLGAKQQNADMMIPEEQLDDAQHWLENIYDEGGGVPPVFAKPTQPVPATVLGRGRLIGETAEGDIQHVVLELPRGFRYVEGQSVSVIPPGTDANTGKPHKPRLYSIASTRYGDLLDGTTVSLCVRRALYYDSNTGRVDMTKAGVCSNFLCDTKVGDTVQVAGPVGKTMLLPENPDTDIIMVATGTGIAPFRGFLHRLFVENTVARHLFNGHAWLILGVPTSDNLLYEDEFQSIVGSPNLEITYAISREMTNQQGGKLYVQDVLAERAEELFNKLDKGAVIYFCGLSGMMPGILESLEMVANQRGLVWSDYLKNLKANHQWHVEVY